MTPPSSTSITPATLTDAELLRRYEPVLRFTQGEAYFPTDVDRYVAHCSLWISHANGWEECVIPRGEVTLEKLAETRAMEAGAVQYLKFAEDSPSAGGNTQQIIKRGASTLALQRGFQPGINRLARVGYLARLADAGISLSMLVRGRVPAATAIIAEQLSAQIQGEQPVFMYYGRVVRDGGWVCLNYWFFYQYDDWRSGFDGVNDHEADWENISVFLYETEDGMLTPEWVVLSCHDFTGNDLRRRWDDAHQLEIVQDTHPVAYVGAGSHAHYYRPGEYLIESAIPWLSRLEPLARTARRSWRKLFGDRAVDFNENKPMFTIPFVEYARGEGLSIGPGQQHAWQQALLDPAPDWLCKYPGMWGLFVRDPVGGENAPAGPMHTREGQPRFSWYAPLAYAGLDSMATPVNALAALTTQRNALAQRQCVLDESIQAKALELQTAGEALSAMTGYANLQPQFLSRQKQVDALRDELRAMRQERMASEALMRSLDGRVDALNAGERDDPRAHINILQTPMSVESMRFERAAQLWSAVSIGLLLAGIILIMAFTAGSMTPTLLMFLIVGFLLVDSLFRRNIAQTATQISITLAVITAVLLIVQFWWPLIVVSVVGVGLYLIRGNLVTLFAVSRSKKKR